MASRDFAIPGWVSHMTLFLWAINHEMGNEVMTFRAIVASCKKDRKDLGI